MKKCKYCQSEIDDKAKICPHCGKKQNGKFGKWIIIGIVLIIIVSCSLGGDEENNSTNNKQTTFKVGEMFSNDYMNIRFDSVTDNFIDYYEFATVKNGFKVVKASFSFENVGSSDELASSYDFNCYADGVAYDQFYSVDDSAFSHTLSSGKKASGDVYCEVPINSTSITLEYDTNFWTSENIEFIVK